MIYLLHNLKTVIEVFDMKENKSIHIPDSQPMKSLFLLAEQFPDRQISWCHDAFKNDFNKDYLNKALHHQNMMISFSTNSFMRDEIGYVEDSPFLKVNKTHKYPTWLMSASAGSMYGSTLLKFKSAVSSSDGFNYSLNSIAKIGITQGLFCYSDPSILSCDTSAYDEVISYKQLYRFISQHYKKRWRYLFLLNNYWFDSKLQFLSFLSTSFQNNRVKNVALNNLEHTDTDNSAKRIDVLIPTIGRKTYLHDVLKDLAKQTLLPKNIIIIEQNPQTDSKTELDYIKNETWPFEITHKFIHQTGACNARNLGLSEVVSEYLFLADDDVRISENTLDDSISMMVNYKLDAVTLSCLKPDEKESQTHTTQWASFGSGCSIVKTDCIKDLQFDMAFEHGFGEDTDFGMQIRNKGYDVAYLPANTITHLKAPIGGFRTKTIHPWEIEEIQPKPSPTVMLNRLRNTTKHQLLGYKTVLCFKFYKDQDLKNPMSYLKKFRKQWKQSVSWANKLNKQNN